MQLYSYQNIYWYQFQNFEQFPNLKQAVSTRGPENLPFSIRIASPGGLGNRQQMCQILGLEYKNLICANQVHSANIAIVTKNHRGLGALSYESAIPETDALVTADAHVPLLILSADCPMVALYAPKVGVIAGIHAGWRGTVQAITYLTAQKICQQFNCTGQDIWAGIAPSIGPCCYEVGLDVLECCQKLPNGNTWYEQRNGKWYLNLWKANQDQLLLAGVPLHQIEIAGLCSMCNWQLFFSYRLAGKATGHIGMFMQRNF